MGKEICPSCSNEYVSLGQHWNKSSCDPPTFSIKQKYIIRGLLLGDGSLVNREGGGHPRLQVNMTSEEYLNYLDEVFGPMSTGVTEGEKESEAAKRNGGSPEDYKDIYRWGLRRMGPLDQFTDWYQNGDKVFPADLELTPTVLKHWYCGDGHFNESTKRIEISMSNEIGNSDKIKNYFTTVGLPEPTFRQRERKDRKGDRFSARFDVSSTDKLFEYMGDPLPGFERKWK